MGAFTMRIDHNIVDVQKMLNGIHKDLEHKAIIPAVNKTAATVKTRVVKKIAEETNSKQKSIRDKIKVNKAHRGSKKQNAQYFAVVDATNARSLNLIEYVRPSKKKVGYFNKVTVTKSGKRKYRSKGVVANAWGKSKVYNGTFIGTSGSGDLKVYRRIGSGKNITQVPGPSPAAIFRKPETFEFMRSVVRERFPIEFERAVKMVLARMKK